MTYTKVILSYTFEPDYLEDILLQGLADLGFETFDEKDAYIQTELLDRAALDAYIFDFNAQYATIVSIAGIEDVPDQNWNAAWEAEHPMEELPDGVKIVPHCAFGAGHHETTGMMISALIAEQKQLAGKSVLDQGCGTGVLGIYAAKYGAHVTAVDIDDKSTCNTQENAELNGVTLDIRCQSSVPEGAYDLILVNIHRNILLSMMDDFARYLKPEGEVWLSGFYEADVESLTDAAKAHGFVTKGKMDAHGANGEWRMLKLTAAKLHNDNEQ